MTTLCVWCGESHPIEEARLKCGFCGAAVTCADADNRNSSDCERCWNEEKAERRAEMEADEREEHAKLMADAWEHDAYDRKGDR